MSPPPYDRNTLRRVRVPGEGSCLFLSVDLIMNGGQLRSESGRLMRTIIVEEVWNNQQKYDGILRSSSKDYCHWIMKESSWGGSVELEIFSKYYAVEIISLHIFLKPLDWMEYGTEANYEKRIFLVYNGKHYDPLVTSEKTIFSRSDNAVWDEAFALARLLNY